MNRTALLRWYDSNARDLPWRRTRDPYAIWVSEIMLQQTRVETVIPYWERFLARFPDASSLARATEDEVLSMWSGLGYYRRARLLHRGVKVVVERHEGRVPEDAEARASLPGIGRYTAGAIGSIAFDRQEPIVDGNVARVLSRAQGIVAPLGSKESERALWNAATEIVRGPRPGALNQALMELGATICTPLSPRCEACPLKKTCVAYAEDRVEALPVPRKKKAPRPVAMVAVIARPKNDARAWLVRGEGTLFGGLFGVPMIEGTDRAAAKRALVAHGITGTIGDELGAIEHVLTHRRLSVRVLEATTSRVRETATRKLAPEDVGVATLTRKILRLADRSRSMQR